MFEERIEKITGTKKDKDFMKTLMFYDKEPVEVENPFSKKKVVLEPIAIALYDYIKGAEATGFNFRQALHIFMENWPTEYMELLD